MDVDSLIEEITTYIESIDVGQDGEHLWDNYQEITAISLRLQEIRNQVAAQEITGKASPELKKFRTMLLDPTIDRLDKLAQFESRKITARQIEFEMERR